MEFTATEIWKKTLSDLEISMSSQHFHMWIEKAYISEVRLVGEEHAIVVVGAPTAMHVQMIEGRFYATVKETLDKVTGKKVDLQFKVQTPPIDQTTSATPSIKKKEPLETQANTLFSSIPTIDSLKVSLQKAKLRLDFVFDSFAVSTTNEMAYAAAQAVSRSPGSAYNPLFLYGGVGVGKTHLMQAVGHNILKDNPQTSILYCAGEEFTNEIISAIQTKKTMQFKE